MNARTYSLIVPLYQSEANLPVLLDALQHISTALAHELEVVFVIDGGTDNTLTLLGDQLASMPFQSRVLCHSRNFGAFAAIHSGLAAATGQFFAVMAADLQEPPELILQLFCQVSNPDTDIVVAYREARNDGAITTFFSNVFWWLYRTFVIPDIPVGGVGTIACNRNFRDQLLKLDEKQSSLIGLVFWMGFRRKAIPYSRMKRKQGSSNWTLAKKINYFFDSLFSFSDLPIKILIAVGAIGLLISTVLGLGLVISHLLGMDPPVPGYAATVLTILFFGCINIVGLGIIGAYTWRAFSNTQKRPMAIVMETREFQGKPTNTGKNQLL